MFLMLVVCAGAAQFIPMRWAGPASPFFQPGDRPPFRFRVVVVVVRFGVCHEHYVYQGYPSEPTSPPPLRRERDAKAARREDDPGWAGDPGGRAASAGPSSAWGSR